MAEDIYTRLMAKLEGLEKGQRELIEQVSKLATDKENEITGLYRHVTGEVATIREQLARMEQKQDKTAKTMAYVIQDVYLLQKKAGNK